MDVVKIYSVAITSKEGLVMRRWNDFDVARNAEQTFTALISQLNAKVTSNGKNKFMRGWNEARFDRKFIDSISSTFFSI